MNEVEKYYDLKDPSKKGPRGFIFAYDEDGKLLFTEENMIVKTGRNALMNYGFDKIGIRKGDQGSKITKVLIGNSEEITSPNDSIKNDVSKIGNIVKTISTRISEYVSKNHNLNGVVTEEKYGKISTNFDIFSSLTIDHSNGSIIYTDSTDNSKTKTLIHASNDTSRGDDEVNLNGFDGSCFDIMKNTTDNSAYALVKIFIRQSYDDNDGATSPSEQISCIGLCMGDTLFSRVVFPRYFKSASQAIVFDYYIYF